MRYFSAVFALLFSLHLSHAVEIKPGPVKVDGTTLQNSAGTLSVKSGGIGPTQLASFNYSLSSSSGTASFTSAITAITNLSVSLTTHGRPVFVGLISDGPAANYSYVKCYENTSTNGNCTTKGYFYRDSTIISLQGHMGTTGIFTASTQWMTTASAYWHIDFPTAGTYTYAFKAATSGATVNGEVRNVKLIAFEL